MKAYVVRNESVIEPFGEYARDCLVGNTPLSTIQKNIFSRLGIQSVVVKNTQQISDPNEHLVVGDHIYFTQELLAEFIKKSRQQKENTVCALKKGLLLKDL